MVKDITPGAAGNVEHLTTVGDSVYFTGGDGELWKSDGTTQGTVTIREITGNPEFGWAGNLSKLGNSIVFRSGTAVWKTDGTSAGTIKLKDLTTHWSIIHDGTVETTDGTVHFSNREDDHHSSLWKTDGTPEGTIKIRGFEGANPIGHPKQLTSTGSHLFFLLQTSSTLEELWRSDGTEEGTVKLGEFTIPKHNDNELVAFGNAVYLAAAVDGGNVTLYRADGVLEEVIAFKIWPAQATENRSFTLSATDDTLFFGFSAQQTSLELWKTDGSPEGTTSILTLPDTPVNYLTSMNHGGIVYFSFGTYSDGAGSLWRSDGTTGGTSLLRAFPRGYGPGLSEKAIGFGNSIYFNGYSIDESQELWKSDGTPEGTLLFQNISRGGTTLPYDLVPAGGVLYFTLFRAEKTVEVWQTDGTPTGTLLVKSIELAESFSPALSALTVSGNDVYFISSETSFMSEAFSGVKLWKISAPSTEAVLVKSFTPAEGYFQHLTPLNGLVYFTAFTRGGVESPFSWKSDGTEAGTVSADGDFPQIGGFPIPEATIGNISFFSRGTALWKTDGTPEGTIQVIDLGADAEFGLSPRTSVGQKLFFSSYGRTLGHRLWKTDGTAEGTVMIGGGYPTWGPLGISKATENAFFFSADSSNRLGLWRCDAESDTAIPVITAEPVPSHLNGSQPLIAAGRNLYFAVHKSYTESELWITDGSTTGTRRVKDISPALSGSLHAPPIAVYHGEIFFAARTPETGYEIWRTDGTEEGTRILKDIATGTGDSQFESPYPLKVFGNKLFFTAMTEEQGPSLYIYDNTGSAPPAVSAIRPTASGLYSADLAGSILPQGNLTTAWIEYGTTNGFGQTFPLPLHPSNATTDKNFLIQLPDLLPDTTYHYRLVARNAGGTTTGTTSTFTTPAITGPFGMDHPRIRLARLPNETQVVRFDVIAHSTYDLQRSIDLNHWETISRHTSDAAGVIEITDEASPQSKAFYRLAVPE